MKHAGSDTLDRLAQLLEALRGMPGLKEMKRGIFYRRSRAFLHFHEDPEGIYADVRGSDGTFERIRVDTSDGQDVLLKRVGEVLSGG